MLTETITGRCTINMFCGDCMPALREMRAGQYSLAICDPEYGIGADKKNSTSKKQSAKSATTSKDYGSQEWDSNIQGVEYFEQLLKASKNQIIWGVNYYPCEMLTGGRIYWNKNVTMPTYSDGELAYCSLINSVRSFTYTWHGMLQGNMKNKENRIHPTQKPVALYKWLLKNYAKEGDTILDTHGGSLSLAIACWDLGFDLDVWELDNGYYADGVARVRRHTAQGQFDI